MAKGVWKKILLEVGVALAVVFGREIARVAGEYATDNLKSKKPEKPESSKNTSKSGTS